VHGCHTVLKLRSCQGSVIVGTHGLRGLARLEIRGEKLNPWRL